MSSSLRKGRALLYDIVSSRQSGLRQILSSESSHICAGASGQSELPLSRTGHKFRGPGAVHKDWRSTEWQLTPGEAALQARRASSSMASTSSPHSLLPTAARQCSSRSFASSAENTQTPSGGPAAGPAGRKPARLRHATYKRSHKGAPTEGLERSCKAYSSASSTSDSKAIQDDEKLAASKDEHRKQRSHSRASGKMVGQSPTSRVSKRKRHLEGLAAEMLKKGAEGNAEAAAKLRGAPAKRLKLPEYAELNARATSYVKGDQELHLTLEKDEKDKIFLHTTAFARSAKMRDAALALYVNAKLFPVAAHEFKLWVIRGVNAELRDALLSVEPGEAEDALFKLFAEYVIDNFSEEIKGYSEAINMLDLRKPHLWYPIARSLQRRLVYHMGPTNSGKTYNALQAMRAARSGVYCGPLRLLAMEIYDELNAAGTYCNLITGQERSVLPSAQHTACTIEMTNLSKRVDVAIIDEIQQIGEPQRGWAWTRALQGVPANEIHLCGDGSVLPLIKRLAADMNEPLKVHEYSRFTPLVVESGGLERGYLDVQPGDCVVAFSRKDIYDIKQLIEAGTGQRVCVVYGALPPEMRRTQARLFNDPDSGYDVLVASDAVGMGLNLNIRRIIFHTLSKVENGVRVPISTSQIKQIGGRAGRRSSKFGQGLVTCLNAADTMRLRQALEAPLDSMSTPTAGLFPEFEQLEAFAGSQLEDDFHTILARYTEEAQIDGTYMMCRQDSVARAAKFLAGVSSLSLQERFWFCMAPANLRSPASAAALMLYAKKYAARQPVSADISFREKMPTTPEELCELEAAHQVISLWIWLSYRFPEEYFPSRDHAKALSERVIEYMSDGLCSMFGPTAAIVSPKARKAACEKFATWTNGAKDASQVAELVGGSDTKGFDLKALNMKSLGLNHGAKASPGAELEVA